MNIYLNKFAAYLEKALRPKILLFLVGILLFCALLLTFFSGGPSVFHIDVRTDKIVLSPAGGQPMRWPVKSVDLKLNGQWSKFSGFVEPNTQSSITVRRLGEGDLTISIHNTSNSAAYLYSEDDEFQEEAKQALLVKIANPQSRYKAGHPITFSFESAAVVGRNSSFGSVPDVALLRSGTVNLITRAILPGDYYIGKPFELTLGDSIVLQPAGVVCYGFLTIDEQGGMHAVYNAQAASAAIYRYRSSPLPVVNSVWQKIYSDPGLSLLWSIVIALFALIELVLSILAINPNKD